MTQHYGPHSDTESFTRFQSNVEFLSDTPVSVDMVRMLRQNALHMFDMSTQIVCNIVAPTPTQDIQKATLSSSNQHVISVPFPMTFRLDGAPSTLVYRVGIGDDDLQVWLNVVPLDAPYLLDRQSDFDHSDAFISVTGTNTFGSGVVWAISGFKSFELTDAATLRAKGRMRETEISHPTHDDSGLAQDSSVVTNWWRADVYMETTGEATQLQLHGLYIRQFMPIKAPA